MERFWSKVDIKGPDECWLWQAEITKNGYGKFTIGHHHIGAHRMAYELEVGIAPPNKIVRHTCDNSSCVNPAHLLLGTSKDNSQDMVKRGRSNRGSKHPKALLNEEQVLAIRQLFSGGKTIHYLSGLYAIKPRTIEAVVYRQNWGWLY